MTILNHPPTNGATTAPPPVLIIGAGLSGLLLAQHLQYSGVPYRIFERDVAFSSRGAGWGLTLHWSLPALHKLLPPSLSDRICDEASVDRHADRRGEVSRFPFFNYKTGELMTQTPGATGAQRVRVTRERLKRLLAEGVDVEYGKSFVEFTTNDEDSVTAHFEDGTSATGLLLVACDGGQSRVRSALFPEESQRCLQLLPVRTMGAKILLHADKIEAIRKLDLFFLQGASPEDNTFMYISVLDVPGNQADSNPETFSCQLHVSWPYHNHQQGHNSTAPLDVPETNAERCELFHSIARNWVEPFRSLVLDNISPNTDIKRLDVIDWPPPKGLHSTGRVVLVGDAMHLMAMYRGEGANHAIVDVLDFADLVVPHLSRAGGTAPNNDGDEEPQARAASASHGDGAGDALESSQDAVSVIANGNQLLTENQRDSRQATLSSAILRQALDAYEDAVVSRARPGVLASRRACLDAHNWTRLFGGTGAAATITGAGPSPLLSKREMKLDFEDESTQLLSGLF